MPSNSSLKVFACAAFVQKHKENWRDKFEERTEKGIYLDNEHGLHKLYLYESRRVTTTKHVSFDEHQLSFLRRTIESPSVL